MVTGSLFAFRASAMETNEEFTRQAWQASPLAIVTIDRDYVIRFINPAGVRIFGRLSDELEGSTITEMTHPLDRLALTRMLDEARTGGVPPRQEVRFSRPDGSEVVTGLSVAPTQAADHMSVCVVRDLSSEKALRPQLLHTERMASMGLVASVVAHELNNALAGAVGCLELLEADARTDQADLIANALRELQRSAEIVSDLKGYARVDGQMSETIDVGELISGLVRLHRYHQADQPNCEINLHMPVDVPVLCGNKNQLLQALLNLVRNAEDAVAKLPEERRHLEIEITERQDAISISVVDHGPGVPVKLRSRLFDPFYSTKEVGSGTGLGLTVVQAVVAGHGGRVEILETPGGGSTFRLLIPKGRIGTAMPEVAPGSDGKPHVLTGLHILIADDEPTMRAVIDRICQKFGARTTVVQDASEAIEALKHESFDVYLLDVRMPGGGGPEVFRHLQTQAGLISRAIFMSGELSPEMSEIVGGGYAGILQKPFQLPELIDMLCKAVGRDSGEGSAD